MARNDVFAREIASRVSRSAHPARNTIIVPRPLEPHVPPAGE
ncbi:hypothetical protein BURMUCF2_B0583 [Burkholderia multivorans CF2]|nr:hypothetical protein BURMUCF2_B0583 [Burkholderia multivorans CF2]